MTLRRKILFSIVLAVLVLGGAELAFRAKQSLDERGADAATAVVQQRSLQVVFDRDLLTVFHVPDQDFVDRTKPAAPYPVHINGHGFRGPDLDVDLPPDHLRVLVLGDSNVFGPGVDDAHTMPARLEAMLADGLDGRPVEVLNASVSGSTISDQWLMLEHRGLPLEPDAVAVGYCANDIGDLVDRALRQRRQDVVWSYTRPVSALGRALRASALYRHMVGAYARRRAHQIRGELPQWFMDGGHSADAIPPGVYPEVEEAIATYEAYLERLGALSRERDLPVYFFAVPDRLPPEDRKRPVFERLYAKARAVGLVVADPWPLYRRHGIAELFDPVHEHPNALGLELLARATADAMLADPRLAPTHARPSVD